MKILKALSFLSAGVAAVVLFHFVISLIADVFGPRDRDK